MQLTTAEKNTIAFIERCGGVEAARRRVAEICESYAKGEISKLDAGISAMSRQQKLNDFVVDVTRTVEEIENETRASLVDTDNLMRDVQFLCAELYNFRRQLGSEIENLRHLPGGYRPDMTITETDEYREKYLTNKLNFVVNLRQKVLTMQNALILMQASWSKKVNAHRQSVTAMKNAAIKGG